MHARRWLAVVLAVLVVGGAATLYRLPDIVRRVAVARIHAITGRPVSIDAVELSVLTGRFAVRGFRLAERDGATPLAEFQRLDGRLHLPSLLLGHVWLRELTLSDSIVRLVRLPNGMFNISDLVQGSEATEKSRDFTVDRFQVVRGRATLEDQALAQPRTWSSEGITIDAYDVSTRKAGGRATGRSIIAGAPASFDITDLRLHPIHLEATAKVEGLDVTPASVYLPPDAHVRLERGRVTSTVTVSVDARDGIRADAHARLLDIVLLQPGNAPGATQPLARAPDLKAEVAGFGYREGHLRLDRLVVDGTMSVRDPTSKRGASFQSTTVRASVTELTWPATTPGRIDAQATVPGGGLVAVVGTVRPPPAATQLRVRVSKLDLAPWAQFVPLAARVTGIAEADLRINEPFAAGIPARVAGLVAVNGLTVADARQDVLRARRIEASGLEVQWPSRVAVTRITLTGPAVRVERDASGTIVIPLEMARAGGTPQGTRGVHDGDGTTVPQVMVGEILVRGGAAGLRDASVTPPARLDVSAVDAAGSASSTAPSRPRSPSTSTRRRSARRDCPPQPAARRVST